MSAKSMQCCYPGCRYKTKLNQNNLVQLDKERGRVAVGGTVGVICPQHVKDAILDEDEYNLEMTYGEILAELTLEAPRWRFCHIPAGSR